MAQYRESTEALGRALNPGLLREPITITSPTDGGQNAYGEPTVTWSTHQACRARIEALRGAEMEAVQQTWAEARLKVTTHFIAGVKREMRITWGSRTLEILDVEDPNGMRERLVIYCRELVE